MVTKKTSSRAAHSKSEAALREERLKAALKSNMARRKAQTRARNASGDQDKNE